MPRMRHDEVTPRSGLWYFISDIIIPASATLVRIYRPAETTWSFRNRRIFASRETWLLLPLIYIDPRNYVKQRVFSSNKLLKSWVFSSVYFFDEILYSVKGMSSIHIPLNDLDVFILIVSCICHDLDHPGWSIQQHLSDKRQHRTGPTTTSRRWENHHCSVAFRVLRALKCNILVSLDNACRPRRHNNIYQINAHTELALQRHLVAGDMSLSESSLLRSFSRPPSTRVQHPSVIGQGIIRCVLRAPELQHTSVIGQRVSSAKAQQHLSDKRPHRTGPTTTSRRWRHVAERIIIAP